MDNRTITLAKNLVNYSCGVKKGEKVFIDFYGHDTADLARQLVIEVLTVGGIPFTQENDHRLIREQILGGGSEEFYQQVCEWDSVRMKAMDCYIGVRGNSNSSEWSDIPPEKKWPFTKNIGSKKIHGTIRINTTRWVVLRYPNSAMSQMAGMSTSGFEDFYYNVCNLDYNKMSLAMDPLVTLMEKNRQSQNYWSWHRFNLFHQRFASNQV